MTLPLHAQTSLALITALGVADTGDIARVELVISGKDFPRLTVTRCVFDGTAMVREVQALELRATTPMPPPPGPPANA